MDNKEYICCTNDENIRRAREKILQDELVYDTADFFKVLGDSTRVKILYTISDGEMCVGDLAEALSMTQSAVSHQLRVLKQCGLVRFRKEGKTVFYELDDAHVTQVLSQGLEHVSHRKGYTNSLSLNNNELPIASDSLLYKDKN